MGDLGPPLGVCGECLPVGEGEKKTHLPPDSVTLRVMTRGGCLRTDGSLRAVHTSEKVYRGPQGSERELVSNTYLASGTEENPHGIMRHDGYYDENLSDADRGHYPRAEQVRYGNS